MEDCPAVSEILMLGLNQWLKDNGYREVSMEEATGNNRQMDLY